ncbi:hypothetical protein VOLCADRAFT_107760 [Volvox carteri f. nagariensis]|uniref:SBP-type domain-containing protein n=1 Tax=Volvox carteri f. nagariensis TaxID=3068 RepID=D8UG66_VOLCA|nr:uncharacterized protein VOLCADRAFT_107760 [Volvox carteri f. nagariensis]EFJ41324.1 hypothetical protein VOLCADRAFT_107760 [Volvox carteri f. nagariensis]|eukprot:XP_002957658.1 hypothetical protein VOLCADRAFT_107760 [Volvox carteri f. nagariensis]
MKAPQVWINGEKMRYCQQCGHFENLDMFIGANRSCKMSLDRRSAIAHASKRKELRSAKSRDQEGNQELSASDNTSSDKGERSGWKDLDSTWGSPEEMMRTESSRRNVLASATHEPHPGQRGWPGDIPSAQRYSKGTYLPCGNRCTAVRLALRGDCLITRSPTGPSLPLINEGH